jgi:Prophage CP4-57 regulatory protein (AlpA)
MQSNTKQATEAPLNGELWAYSELKRRGIVNDRATLRRRMRDNEFPAPIVLSGNAIAWPAAEVVAWLNSRPRGAAPQPERIARLTRSKAAAGALPVA